jgi:hypothetical protein
MWYSTVSPGSTGLRNFTLSAVMKNTCFGGFCSFIFGDHADRPRGLGHALDQEHAREDRAAREMAGELRLVEGDVLDADAGAVAVDLDDPVHQEERDSGAAAARGS